MKYTNSPDPQIEKFWAGVVKTQESIKTIPVKQIESTHYPKRIIKLNYGVFGIATHIEF